MRRLLLLIAPILVSAVLVGSVLAVAASAAAAGGITGSYTTTISGSGAPSQLKGVWHLTWTGGKETIAKGTAVVVNGHYVVSGKRITFSRESGPAACTAPGVYNWSLRGKTLTLKLVRDTCLGRQIILTAGPLHKVG